MHKNNFSHNDLKPSNIIHSEDNGVKLLDFGALKNFEKNVIKEKCEIYTPLYAAPE